MTDLRELIDDAEDDIRTVKDIAPILCDGLGNRGDLDSQRRAALNRLSGWLLEIGQRLDGHFDAIHASAHGKPVPAPDRLSEPGQIKH